MPAGALMSTRDACNVARNVIFITVSTTYYQCPSGTYLPTPYLHCYRFLLHCCQGGMLHRPLTAPATSSFETPEISSVLSLEGSILPGFPDLQPVCIPRKLIVHPGN